MYKARNTVQSVQEWFTFHLLSSFCNDSPMYWEKLEIYQLFSSSLLWLESIEHKIISIPNRLTKLIHMNVCKDVNYVRQKGKSEIKLIYLAIIKQDIYYWQLNIYSKGLILYHKISVFSCYCFCLFSLAQNCARVALTQTKTLTVFYNSHLCWNV